MKSSIIDISFVPDIEFLVSSLCIKNSHDIETIMQFCKEAQEIARPRFAYNVSFIEETGEDFLIADRIRFNSRVLSVNLFGLNRIFPIIATCGREIEEWSKGIHDILYNYWADKIKEMALETARKNGIEYICKRYNLKDISFMSPGSITDWPLSEQTGLFSLLGNAASDIGVELTDSFLMLPPKTVSVIMFETQIGYDNCQLCPREKCPNRRAIYTPDLYEKRYALQKRNNAHELIPNSE